MKLIDLTLTLESGMRGVEIEQKYTTAERGWNAKTLSLYSHCGTHMDAPVHFDVSDESIDQISLERCIGMAHVVDLTDIGPRELIEPSRFAKLHVRPGDILLLKTGWSRYADDPEMYRREMPRISVQSALWMVDKRIKLVGVETPSVADVYNKQELQSVHTALLAGGVLIVEGLANLEQIRQPYIQFFAFPLKIKDGDGSPCRAFVLEAEPENPDDSWMHINVEQIN